MSTSAPKIKGLAHVGLNVSDPVNAARWYCNILGMKEIVTGYDTHQEAAVFLSFGERHHDMYPDEKGREGQKILREKGAPTIPVELEPIY